MTSGYNRLSSSRAGVSSITRSEMFVRLSSGGGDSTVGAREPNSALFLLPKDTPQLLAKLANVLAAVRTGLAGWVVFCIELFPASGDDRGI